MESSEIVKAKRQTVRILVQHDNKILLLRKSPQSQAAGLWEFPGGNIETGQDKTDAALAELDQETGISSSPEDLLELEPFEYTHNKVKRSVFMFQLDIHGEKPNIEIGKLEEDLHDKYMWVNKEEFLKLKSEHKLNGNTENFDLI